MHILCNRTWLSYIQQGQQATKPEANWENIHNLVSNNTSSWKMKVHGYFTEWCCCRDPSQISKRHYPFPDTGCPVPDVSIYYMSNINELPDGILFHWFCKCTPPWMFLPLDIPSEYRPEHVTFGLLCVIFKFPSRIFCRRVPGLATDCPCGVWCRGLTTCLLYVGPPLEF